MSKRNFILAALLVAVLQSAALGAMIYNRAMKLENGAEVVLRSQMRDPRDLFRGHYTRLNLDLGEMKVGKIKTVGDIYSGKPVFVELKKGDDLFWVAETLYETLPEKAEGPIIRGMVSYSPFIKDRKNQNSGQNDNYRIRLPIDQYFAEKKRALDLEKVQRDQKLGVILALDENGYGNIKGITIDGKLLYEESLF